MLSQKDAFEIIQREAEIFSPFVLRSVEEKYQVLGRVVDFSLCMELYGKEYSFFAEYKPMATPKLFENAILQMKSFHLEDMSEKLDSRKVYPLIIVPYLSEDNLARLEMENVSGFDLCGNCIVCIPPNVFVYKTGKDNRYPDSRALKNPFLGKSSLVARVLLANPFFDSVSGIQKEIKALGGELSLGAVSKALSALEDLLLVRKMGREAKLLQPEKMLRLLQQGYKRVESYKVIKGKVGGGNLQTIADKLFEIVESHRFDLAVLWMGSMNPYAAFTRPESIVAYINSEEITNHMDIDTNSKFPNLELRVLDEPMVFFDRRRWLENIFVVSPVEVFLELMSGGKREQEIAEQVKGYILEQLKGK
ncbi:MAG: hypothetical protein H6728_16385 [Myxococcales bacterium]|nr:hypothetical protein [Myxococcales bacterium]